MRTFSCSAFAACLVSLIAFGAGCAETSEDDVEVSGDELRALSTSEIVGTLGLGETKRVTYTSTPTYRAFELRLEAGATIDLRVTSADGNPRAYLLGDRFQTLATSTDVSATDKSARIAKTVRTGGKYYLAVREETLKNATFDVTFVDPNGPKSCTSDEQCGGGANMCFIDRCARVEDSAKGAWSVNGIAAAFDGAGALQVAYTTYKSGQFRPSFPLAMGPWSGTPSYVTTLDTRPNGSGATSGPWSLDRAPGMDPKLAWINDGAPDTLAYGDAGSPSLPASPQDVSSFAVAENSAGTKFAAFQLYDARERNDYTVWFASRPANGTWSALEKVYAPGSPIGGITIHPRRDGSADVLFNSRYALVRARRQNPVDPWSLTNLVTASTSNAELITARGGDGTTHVVFSSTSGSSPTQSYDTQYVEIGDEGVVRTVPVGKARDEAMSLYRNMGVDGSGNVWIQKRSGRGIFTPSVVRVDRNGNVATRSLGSLNNAEAFSSSLAVAKNGELALLWVGAGGQGLNVRRFIPTR